MVQVVNSEITRLKRMRGQSRIWEENELSNYLLSLDFELFPGIGHQFLESRKWETEEGEWIEHKLLLRASKLDDNLERLGYLMETLGKLIKNIRLLPKWKVENIGLEEVDCSDPVSYFFLIYILADGKDRENESEKILFD